MTGMNNRRSHERRAGAAARAAGSQRGAGLIEVMVAIVVLSLGLFAIVLSQLNSIRGQRSSHMRATAVQLAGDMAERMRLNVAAFGSTATGYADADSVTYVSLTASAGTTGPSAPTIPSTLDAAAQATFDLDAWRFQIARRLGVSQATGVVRVTDGQPMSRTVVVMWPESQPTKALATAGALTRGNACPTTAGASKLACDAGCPTDGTVNGAQMNLRCVQIAVQP